MERLPTATIFGIICIILTVSAQLSPACSENKTDIVFLLDASSSEGIQDFKQQLEFVKNFTEVFDIGKDHVQIGLVTFSTYPHNAFNLKDYQNKTSLLNAIDHVQKIEGGTRTDEALRYVRQHSFRPENGGRNGVKRNVIVLTDGNSALPSRTASEANILHLSGIKVISVGIGQGVSLTELLNIATDDAHAFSVGSFGILNSIVTELQETACTSEKLRKVNYGCGGQADIVFILDSSSSEGSANFHKMMDFVTDFVNQFSVGPNEVQFGLVTFATNARNEFYLNSYSDKMDVISKLQNVTYSRGSRATHMGLQYALNFQFKSQHGARANTTHIAIVMTDGQSNDIRRTITEAHRLQQSGVKVVSVGIGGDLNQYELGNIASNLNDVHTVGSFDTLHTIQADLKEAACGSKPESTQNPENDCWSQTKTEGGDRSR